MLNMNASKIVEIIEKWTQQGAHLWYEASHAAAVERYGANASKFLRIAAALSQRRRVGDDLKHAAWVISNPTKNIGECPYKRLGISPAFSTACEQARLVRDGLAEHASGPKIGAFSRALVLDPTLHMAVCDVHVCVPLVGTRTPKNDNQRADITHALACAGALLWPSLDKAAQIRRAQAAFWHESASQANGPMQARSVTDLSYADLIRKLHI